MMLNIVLDLDDTLFLEQDYVKSGFHVIDHYLQEHYQQMGFYQHAWQAFEAGTREQLIFKVLLKLGQDPNLTTDLVNLYRQHKPSITLLPDSKYFLDYFFGKFPLFLITDGRSVGQRHKIKSLAVEPYFNKIIVTGDWGEAFYKPHPRAFLTIQEASPGPCIYFADNPKKDFITPQQLNWLPSIRIRREKGIYQNEPTPEGVIECADLIEALKLIKLN